VCRGEGVCVCVFVVFDVWWCVVRGVCGVVCCAALCYGVLWCGVELCDVMWCVVGCVWCVVGCVWYVVCGM
jgi:hypothetical protein